MSGFLTKLARGIGTGMEAYGKNTMDQQRIDRLAKMKTDAQASQNDFNAGEGKLDRESRERIAMQNKRTSTKTPKSWGAKVHDKDPDTDLELPTYTQVHGTSGEVRRYNPETDSYTIEGSGNTPAPVEDVAPAKSSEHLANQMTNLTSFDSSDFAGMVNEEDRDEDKVAGIISFIRANGDEKKFLSDFNAASGKSDKVAVVNKYNEALKSNQASTPEPATPKEVIEEVPEDTTSTTPLTADQKKVNSSVFDGKDITKGVSDADFNKLSARITTLLERPNIPNKTKQLLWDALDRLYKAPKI